MIIINPIVTNDARLISSTVAENDYPVWAPGTYNTGDRVIKTTGVHKIYEVTASPSTTDDPEVGVAATPPTWVEVGSTNRWAMFDQRTRPTTSDADSIEVVLRPGARGNALALFEARAETVRVEVFEGATTYYDQTVDGLYTDPSGNWYEYFFNPIENKYTFVFLDLPLLDDADIRVTLTATGSTVECGELVIGYQQQLGLTNYGTSVGIIDYSRKERDTFGNPIVVERGFSDRVQYDVTVDTDSVAAVKRRLADLRATKTVYIGDENREETVAYGFYQDFDVVLATPTISECSLDVEGV